MESYPPDFFSFYVDEILLDLQTQQHGCWAGISRVNVQAYADDLVVFCPTASGLQSLLDRVNIHVKKHKLKLNTDKTKIVVFRRHHYISENLSFSIDGSPINIIESFKYLGCVLNYRLSEYEELERIFRSFNQSVGTFYRQFYSVDFEIKNMLLNSLCMSFLRPEFI